MTAITDRVVIFLVCAVVAALTLNSMGLVEKSQVVGEQLQEHRTEELASTIDLVSTFDEGYYEKTLAGNQTVEIGGGEVSLNPDDAPMKSRPLRSNPEPTSFKSNRICIEKAPTGGLTVEPGNC